MNRTPTNNIPTILIILGATGDLMTRKIAPALYHMFEEGTLPTMFKLIGVARREITNEEYRSFIASATKKRIGTKRKTLEEFLNQISYHKGLFQKASTYSELKKLVQKIDDDWGVCTNKLFYIAVPPGYYETIFRHLSASGLTDPCSPDEGWTRVIVEKPFGENYETAKKLDTLLSKLFKEIQIYRVDHYLAKEMIQNILSFRFSNTLFEKIWNKEFIQRIDIRLLEKLGVEDRGLYYDSVGALRDVGQNHILQMLALITMDHPESFESEPIRHKRTEALDKMRPPTKSEIKNLSYRAQYEGYRKIQNVKRNSKTETYFKLGGTFLTSPRWTGVPVILESGKRLGSAKKEIVVTFKHPIPCLCPEGSSHLENKVTFALEPEELIKVQFWAKKPGKFFDIEERDLEFKLRPSKKKIQYVEEYAKLLLDVIAGDQTLFITTNEVRAMWRFTDPIVNAWNKSTTQIHHYKPNTTDAIKSSSFIEKNLTAGLGPAGLSSAKEGTIGMIGLGKMGGNLARHLIRSGWKVVGFDSNKDLMSELEIDGVQRSESIKDLLKFLPKKKVVWIMLPAGKALDSAIKEMSPILKKGDVVIDGGNSYFKDSIERHKKLSKKGVEFIDVGISGGPTGALEGAALMIGGNKKEAKKLEKLFRDLAHEDGYEFFDGPGVGHFVKMIHNGIEYGMMQAIAEGFDILKHSKYKLNLKDISNVYGNGAVIESKLIKLLGDAFDIYGTDLVKISGEVDQLGTGKWTTETAKSLGVRAKIIEEAVKFRTLTKNNPNYAGRILNALRERFGGHSVTK